MKGSKSSLSLKEELDTEEIRSSGVQWFWRSDDDWIAFDAALCVQL
jgi:hypothetical protein